KRTSLLVQSIVYCSSSPNLSKIAEYNTTFITYEKKILPLVFSTIPFCICLSPFKTSISNVKVVGNGLLDNSLLSVTLGIVTLLILSHHILSSLGTMVLYDSATT